MTIGSLDPYFSDLPAGLVGGWVALVGSVVGSFLNVVIARVPAGQSVVRPRSRCPGCRTPIAWYDNLPVISWLALRGRCRACRRPISIRYPAVELLGATLAFLAWHRHGLSASALAELAFTMTLVALAAIDLDTWLLPNGLTWPLLAGGLLASAAGLTAAGGWSSSAAGAAVGVALFGAISVGGERLAKKEVMGLGDVWLLGALGAWLGLAAILPVILLASLQGSVAGLALLAIGRAQPGPPEPVASAALEDGTPEDPPVDGEAGEGVEVGSAVEAVAEDDWIPPRNAVPFGPFLALAALEWLVLGDRLARLVPVLGIFR